MPVSCTPRRCAGGGGGDRTGGGGWGLPGLRRGKKGKERCRARSDSGAAGRGHPAHTPFPGRRCACAPRRIPQFPLPGGGRPGPGLTWASLGGSARCSLGRAGRGAKAPGPWLWLGGCPPSPPPPTPAGLGAGRAIPEKVCRAGLGEQRAGGGGRTRHVCGLVCDSVPFTRRFKGRTASLARKRKNLGAGRLGRISVQPSRSALPLRARLAQWRLIRALAAGHSPVTSPQGARFTTPRPQPRLALSGARAAT